MPCKYVYFRFTDVLTSLKNRAHDFETRVQDFNNRASDFQTGTKDLQTRFDCHFTNLCTSLNVQKSHKPNL